MSKHPFLLMVLTFTALLTGYSVFVSWQRDSKYDSVFFQEKRESVIEKLGNAVRHSECSVIAEGSSVQVDALCKQPKVKEVLQFKTCLVEYFCPPSILIAFDANEKMVYKFRRRDN